eukprot:CAMPEP_0202963810 /NCGR_PEP_ID=MMETSP1396-20130829/7837_1 /ASSEMBLY_ACC=CAM_ASM_000872 /TAXON_ID= /ORGANISM="Pseudokeronopsis sp., Strain Brazil" /LENGTH=99 /DNA_ID=CAMNT_0049685351 /DNA_START=458 /DNA_END=753 /DNA_ORIENTATION=+
MNPNSSTASIKATETLEQRKVRLEQFIKEVHRSDFGLESPDFQQLMKRTEDKIASDPQPPLLHRQESDRRALASADLGEDEAGGGAGGDWREEGGKDGG